MVVLVWGAVSYERGIPVPGFWRDALELAAVAERHLAPLLFLLCLLSVLTLWWQVSGVTLPRTGEGAVSYERGTPVPGGFLRARFPCTSRFLMSEVPLCQDSGVTLLRNSRRLMKPHLGEQVLINYFVELFTI
jgi:hypothetical protein